MGVTVFNLCPFKGRGVARRIGTSRAQVNGKTRRVYNGSWQHVDLSKVPLINGKMKGEITLHMTPDLWIPANGKSFPIRVDIDAQLNEAGQLVGTYFAHRPDIDEPTMEHFYLGKRAD